MDRRSRQVERRGRMKGSTAIIGVLVATCVRRGRAFTPTGGSAPHLSRTLSACGVGNEPFRACTPRAGEARVSQRSAWLPTRLGGAADDADAEADGGEEDAAQADGASSGGDGDGLTLQQRIAQQMGKTVEDSGAAAARREAFAAEQRVEKRNSIAVALTSFLSTCMLFFFTHSGAAPANANPLGMLRAMETTSTPLVTALTNGKPTVVDFYADWCGNCKAMAPTMKDIEKQYKGKVNFVVIDGDSAANADLVEAFRVDGIPHLAMITKEGDVKTAIIGLVPKQVITDDITALLQGDKDLPFKGYDAFDGEEHNVMASLNIKVEE